MTKRNDDEEEPYLNEKTFSAVVTSEKGPKLTSVRHGLEEVLSPKEYQELMQSYKAIISEILELIKKEEYSEEQLVTDIKVFIGEQWARELIAEVKQEEEEEKEK